MTHTWNLYSVCHKYMWLALTPRVTKSGVQTRPET
jgi:hypothetical protein